MYDRIFKSKLQDSFFLFGPRGTGKTSFLKETYKDVPYFVLPNIKPAKPMMSVCLKLEAVSAAFKATFDSPY